MKVQEILDLADNCRGHFVPCFIGAPGIGKTQGVYEWAEKHGRNVVEIIASQCLPSEVAGTGMPDSVTGTWRIYDPYRLTTLKDGDILFFDELLTADQSILFACLTIIQERRLMSGRKLPDIIICAASNPIAANRIDASIKQRFVFVPMGFEAADWCNDYLDKRLQLSWPSGECTMYRWCCSSGLVDYIRNNAEIKNFSKSQWNIVTPRTIEKLIKLYESNLDNKESVKDLIYHCFDENKSINYFISGCFESHLSTAERIVELIDRVANWSASEGGRLSLNEVRERLEDMPEGDMIEFLQELSIWPQLEEAMSKEDVFNSEII